MLGAMLAAAAPAGAQTVWTAPEGQSYAMLPAPEPGTPVTGGVLLCNAQVWTLSLALEADAAIEGIGGHATLTARGQPFSVDTASSSGGVDLAIPHMALEPMMAGIRMHIEFEGERRPVRFSLAGSRRAITAVQEICPPRELPTENSIGLTAVSPWLELGRRLRSSDIRDFVLATSELPELRVAMLDLEGGRLLFFTEICGTSWYYGVSGCNIAGHTRTGSAGEAPSEGDADLDLEGWQQVFESEGAHIYTQPDKARDGWPNLMAIPLKPGSPDKLWAWIGQRYALEDTIQAELRPSQ